MARGGTIRCGYQQDLTSFHVGTSVVTRKWVYRRSVAILPSCKRLRPDLSGAEHARRSGCYGEMFQRGRKVKEGRRWLMNLRVTTLAKNGTLAGRSRFGAFTGNWSTGRSQVRSNKLVPSTSTCGEMRELEEADGSDGSSAGNACGEERHRADAGGKAGSVLVPQQTWSRFGLLGTALDVGQRHTLYQFAVQIHPIYLLFFRITSPRRSSRNYGYATTSSDRPANVSSRRRGK